MTIHFGSRKFQGSYAFQRCIGLKLFLNIAYALCEGINKFEIFLIGLVLFSDLMNF
jgi:multidrug transporter EmrE-like cation transporter